MSAHANGRPVVVVTGIGLVSALGIGKEDTWRALREGRSGARPITRFGRWLRSVRRRPGPYLAAVALADC